MLSLTVSVWDSFMVCLHEHDVVISLTLYTFFIVQ